ncbi:MAG TPA: SusC/RagA family TonB-linked outer membrane protein [Paludibacter sp.]
MMMKTNNIKNIHNVLISLGFVVLSIVPLSAFGQTEYPKVPSDSTATIGYNIKTNTAAISVIKGSDIETHATDNLTNALGGLLTGLSAQQMGGVPGSDGSNLWLRGYRTLSGGYSQPLVLIDNAPGDYSFLDPNEIQTIEILKDAAATAVYGQRGANGVILVTTKRGKVGKMSVKFNTQTGFQELVGLPTFLNSYEYGKLFNEAKFNEGDATPFYDDATLEKYKDQTRNNIYTNPSVDYIGQFLKPTAPIQRYSLSISGGSNFAKYNIVLGIMDQQGFYKYAVNDPKYSTNASSTRYNMRTNLDVQINKRLNILFNLSGQITRNKSPYVGNSTIWSTIMHELPNSYPIFTPSGNLGGTSTKFNNPVGLMSRSGYQEVNNRNMQTMLEANQQLDFITPGLTATLSAAYNGFNTYGYQKKQEFAVYTVDSSLVETIYGLDKPLSDGTDLSNDMNYNISLWASINYERTFGIHSIQAKVMSYLDQKYIPRYSPYSNLNYVATVNYGFLNRYFMGGTLSYSGNDNYAPGRRFGLFYSISGAWDIHKESFLDRNEVVTALKIRSSYGLVGNNGQISSQRYLYQTQYTTGEGYPFGKTFSSSNGTIEYQAGNPFFTWEKSKQFNIGIDGGLFQKVYFSFDYYTDNRYDMLASPMNKLPDIFASTLSYTNIGMVNSKGFEAILGVNEKVGDFKLNVELNATFSDNQVIENGEVNGLDPNTQAIGKQSYGEWGLKSIGFFYDAADVTNSPVQKFGTYAPGDVKYADLNGDNIIDGNDKTRLGGSGIPNLFTSANFKVFYKGFDIGAQIVGLFNREVYIPAEFSNAIPYGGKLAVGAYQRWANYTDQNGDLVDTRSTAIYPRLLTTLSSNNTQNSTLNIKEADFIRLKNIEIGYTLPNAWMKAIKLESIRLFCNGYNLALLYDKAKIGDPEYPGAPIWSYGKTRILSFGASVSF